MISLIKRIGVECYAMQRMETNYGGLTLWKFYQRPRGGTCGHRLFIGVQWKWTAYGLMFAWLDETQEPLDQQFEDRP